MMFARNLTAFLVGLACQVLAGVFPKFAGALLVPASLLLSAADIRSVLDGSFIKHVILFALAVVCQVLATAAPASWNVAVPLLAAGGIMMSASDIKRVFKGPEAVTAPIVTPAAEAASATAKGSGPASLAGGPKFPPAGLPGPVSSEADTPLDKKIR